MPGVVHEALDAEAIAACAPVMRDLRPHVAEAAFLDRVQRQRAEGYRLAYVEAAGEVAAVAGFRLGQNLAWGRYLYVDDLVTRASARSCGHGAQLLGWLRDEARRAGCDALHLDSGLPRKDAHRFYEREGLAITSMHFAESLRDS